jgi:hypothetical protein
MGKTGKIKCKSSKEAFALIFRVVMKQQHGKPTTSSTTSTRGLSKNNINAAPPSPSKIGDAFHTELTIKHQLKLQQLTADTLEFMDTKLVASLNPAEHDDCRGIVL